MDKKFFSFVPCPGLNLYLMVLLMYFNTYLIKRKQQLKKTTMTKILKNLKYNKCYNTLLQILSLERDLSANTKRNYYTNTENLSFFAPIPYTYIHSKNKSLSIFYLPNEINLEHFQIKTHLLEKNVQYTVYTKIRYDTDSYFMAGNQFGFMYTDVSSIDTLYQIVSDRLEKYYEEYNLEDDSVIYIETIFRVVDIKLLSEFSLPDEIKYDEKKKSSISKSINIPVSISEDYLGKPLEVVVYKNIITNI